ncbi:putative protein gravitropic in the light 1 [Helianthus annuus]|uniref:Uncharacterized protein n=1 Tax=Helianthus annuus TaxID=4232 RepID=A0A251VGS6_HELAN|nr:protein GRAVITROPIC IN THE LIGHT 1 [Helianthus annuus]KAF5764818.1 putative protein gravitropic in the light 1 [Helianthus annuus]KAJ0451454.1 putative protein gravitropic in the light 1 [Helianthus annuus]KAJ0455973.1 putative protein gravitropic in the light 1 [Helianthus annuus]KAJ0473331.1 putative protein gravitropic in the light 1 [Helianthus annuus]KAJ0648913.1 putative protein gravitropic in the light 1 [Helianthus annuus]
MASPQPRSKLSKSFQRVITFRKPTKPLSNNGFCLNRPKNSDKHFIKQLVDDAETKNRAAMAAFVAKLFASVSSLKAAYAELQAAQFPYDGEGVKRADQSVVDELKEISELKRSFMKKQIDASPPHVTLLLSEIQEQQSLIRMYQVTISKMEKQAKTMNEKINSLQITLSEVNSSNRVIETTLESEHCFPLLDGIDLSDLTVTSFTEVLYYALASVQDFVKLLLHDMQVARWDINAAVRSIDVDALFPKPSYKCFAFESYVAREIFEGFNASDEEEAVHFNMFNEFKKLKSLSTMHILEQNPRSPFAKFARAKYMRVVHPKMEYSLFGNLSQRKTLNSWQFPATGFFGAFAEMARRVWLLRCLFLSFDEEVSVFRVRKGCRFSDLYMESVVARDDGEWRVGFTVVPGFKIGKQVVQSQVYLSPAGDDSGRKRG